MTVSISRKPDSCCSVWTDCTWVLLQVNADQYTCEAQIVFPLDTPTLLMQEIAEKVAVSTMLRDTGMPLML